VLEVCRLCECRWKQQIKNSILVAFTAALICRQAEHLIDSIALYSKLMDEIGEYREASLSKACHLSK
jgi:hypothetical protein